MTEPKALVPYDLATYEEFRRRYFQYVPLRTPLRSEPECHNARVARERQQREAGEARRQKLAGELAMAEEEHGDMLAFYEDQGDRESNRLAAVLGLHSPVVDYDRVVCTECEEDGGYEDTQSVAWPCTTYQAIRSV